MEQTIWAPTRLPCFFMHIPKTAGMSLRRALASQYNLADKLPAEQLSDLPRVERPLDSYKLFVGHFRFWFRELLPDDVHYITFLRDPIERMISHLKHMSSDPNFNELYEIAKGRDLRSLVEDPRIIAYCSDRQVLYLSDLRPEGIEERGEKDLDAAIEALNQFSFIGFFDDLANDYARVCDLFGLHPPSMLPLSNTAANRKQSIKVDDELRQMIAEVNVLDLELYRQAKSKFGFREPLPPRETRIEALHERGIYRPIEGNIVFDLASPLPATGVWFQEGEPPHVYRWTGPETSFSIEVLLRPHTPYRVELQIRAPHPIGKLAAYVDGLLIPIRLASLKDTKAVIELEIPAKMTQNLTSITLCWEQSFLVSDTDDRSFGFILQHIAMSERY